MQIPWRGRQLVAGYQQSEAGAEVYSYKSRQREVFRSQWGGSSRRYRDTASRSRTRPLSLLKDTTTFKIKDIQIPFIQSRVYIYFFTAPVIRMRLFNVMRINVNKVLLEFPVIYSRATRAVKAYLQITGLNIYDARNSYIFLPREYMKLLLACFAHLTPLLVIKMAVFRNQH